MASMEWAPLPQESLRCRKSLKGAQIGSHGWSLWKEKKDLP